MGACCDTEMSETHNDNLLPLQSTIEVHSVLRPADHAKSNKHVSFQNAPGVAATREPESEQNEQTPQEVSASD